MTQRDNIISTFLILIYLLFVVSGQILLAKLLGVDKEILDCNFNKYQILIYSINEFLIYIDNIVIAIWIYLGARRKYPNGLFYSMLGLVFGLMGLLFYLSMNLIQGKSLSRVKINKVAILLIAVTIISILLGGINRLSGQIALNNIFSPENTACLVEFTTRLESTVGGVSFIIRFLVSFFVAIKLFGYAKSLGVKSAVWIISTLVLGIIPWIALNILILLKVEEPTTANKM